MSAEEWIHRGQKFLGESSYTEAEDAFRRAIEIEAENVNAWNNVALALKGQGKHDEAEEAIRHAIEIDPETVISWWHLGRSLSEQGKYDEAEEAMRCAIEIGPELVTFWYHLGFVLVQQGKYDEAEEAYRRVIEADSGNVDTWHHLGFVLSQQGKYDEAEEAFRRVIEADSEDVIPWYNLGHVLDNREKYDESEEAFRRAIEISPEAVLPWCHLGFVLTQQGKYYEAEEAYRRAIEIDQDFRAWFFLADTLDAQKKYDEAEEAFRRAIDIDSEHVQTWNNLGHVLAEQGKYYEAEEAYRRAIEIAPEAVLPWYNLGYVFATQGKYDEAEEAFRKTITIDSQFSEGWGNLAFMLVRLGKYDDTKIAVRRMLELRDDHDSNWRIREVIAILREGQGSPRHQVLYAYRRMARTIEGDRLNMTKWEERLEKFQPASEALQLAAGFCMELTPQYPEDALRFAIQSKARSLDELVDHDPVNLRPLLPSLEQATLDRLERNLAGLEMERNGWVLEFNYTSIGLPTKHLPSFRSPEQEVKWRDRRNRLLEQRDDFLRQVVIDYPELEPFVGGPKPRSLRFSLPRLQRHLRPDDAVLELLLVKGVGLLGFLVTRDGLVKTYKWGNENSMKGIEGSIVEEWQDQVHSILHIGTNGRAAGIAKNLTEDVLARWGQLIYGPFMKDLKDVHTLWVSPHAFLTQLPFNSIPFPDGAERDVAVIPSAASLTRPRSKGPRAKPRFTLGVVASDSLRYDHREPQPLDLQLEEVRRLRRTVKSARHRWVLTGNKPGEKPTLFNIRERAGLTRCLVLSCHGGGPNEDWGTLALGDVSQTELVTGRQLVDSLILGNRSRNMEVDLVVTSACLTGQVDLERTEEWMGLPFALQSVWKTKAMLLTLWEVEELPAMIWVVSLVEALTQGLTVGEAQLLAQKKVRYVTREQVEVEWLGEARERLSAESWEKVETWWLDMSRTTDTHPFSDPVHWAPFILVGDPTLIISRRRG